MEGGMAIPTTTPMRLRSDTVSEGTGKKSKPERVAEARTPMTLNFGSLPLEDRFEWAGRNVMIERPAKGGSGSGGDFSPVLEAPSCPVAAAASVALAALLAVYSHNNWMPDEETDTCLKCQRDFTMTFRRVRPLPLAWPFSFFLLFIITKNNKTKKYQYLFGSLVSNLFL
jgi:hypothetical protein